MKQKPEAISALRLSNATSEGILLTPTKQLHVLKPNAAGTKFIYLVMNPRGTNLAIAREVSRSHAATTN